MSPVRKLLTDFLSQPPGENNPRIFQGTMAKTKTLKMQQLQQFIRQISHIVYEREQHAHSQILLLKLLKEMLITGSYAVYLLTSAFIFPWVVTICNFHKQQGADKRAMMLLKDVTGRNGTPGSANLESFRLFLIYAEQFLVFFGENYKFYPHSKYKIKNSFAKELQLQQFTRSLSNFTNVDLKNLQGNLKRRGTTFRDELSHFTDFLNAKIEQCMVDASKFHDNLYLLISLVEMSESFCISIIVLRLRSFLTPQHIEIACKTIDVIISTAEIEAVQTINARCLPFILQYLIPADFKENLVLQFPKIVLDASILHKLIDYYYIWHEKTKLLKLSSKIYDYSLGMIECLKKPFKLSFQNQLKGFLANLEKIEHSNEVKRAFVIDQHQQQEEQIVKLLKDVAFCVNSQRVQTKIAYSNVLDDLTITEQQSVSEFGQSLIKSAKRRENQELVSNKSQDSLWVKKLRNSSKLSSRRGKRVNYGQASERQQIQNVYYYKNGLAPSSQHNRQLSRQKAGSIKVRKQQLQPSQNKRPQPNEHYYSKQCQSFADVQYPSIPKVTSKDSRGSKPQGMSSSKSEISLHSSQFSQKDNNQHQRFNRPIQSIYTSRSRQNQNGGLQQDKSGEFLYFEKQSELKSEKNCQKPQGKSLSKSQVQFQDSLVNVNQSQSCQVLQFGMDINAKIPQTISKPKFNFKSTDSNDTDLMLKKKESAKSQQVVSIKPLAHNKRTSPQTIKMEKKATQQSRPSPIQTKYGFQSKASKVKSVESRVLMTPKQNIFKKDLVIDESSGSMIKEISGQPHLISQSISLSNQKVPSNFKEVFRQKSEKASAISSSRSLKRLRLVPERKVEIPDFKKLRNLQNQLGKLKKETQKFNQQLQQKNEQMERLKIEKKQIVENDPYFLKKENQIMKILLKNKQKTHLVNSPSSAKNLNKQLKESSIKNYNMSLKDYNHQTLKLKFANINSYTKQEKKNIVSNRCILLKNNLIQIGYSFKNNEVTLYLTLKNYCDSLEINLLQNSIIFSQSIRRSFDKLYVGKQMKFKTQIKETKQNNKFTPAVVMVKLTYQHKLQQTTQQFNCQLPLTPYNMAIPLSQAEGTSQLSQSRNQMTNYVTPLYKSNEEFIKKGKSYLLNIFPHGYFCQDGSTFTINYKWKDRYQIINIKLKERAFRIEGTGYPIQSGRELIETIINLLIE